MQPPMGKKRKKREAEEAVDGAGASQAVKGHSTRGPPVAYTSGRLSGSVSNDEWQTTRRSWAAVAGHLAGWRKRRVWMPFYYDGKCGEYLRSLGFRDVVHTDEDFFTRVADSTFMSSVDLIFDNPPYTTPEMKEKVLRALAACGKPFVMLLPISILHVSFVREIVPMDEVQAIVPRRVWVRKQTDENETPFKYLCWFCCRAQLPRDLIFVNDDEGE